MICNQKVNLDICEISRKIVYLDTQIHIARIKTTKASILDSTFKTICCYFNISLSEFFEEM